MFLSTSVRKDRNTDSSLNALFQEVMHPQNKQDAILDQSYTETTSLRVTIATNDSDQKAQLILAQLSMNLKKPSLSTGSLEIFQNTTPRRLNHQHDVWVSITHQWTQTVSMAPRPQAHRRPRSDLWVHIQTVKKLFLLLSTVYFPG